MSINTKISDIITAQNEEMKASELNYEEKIDYIYKYVKKQERSAKMRRYVKIFFYLWVLVYFYVMITIVLPKVLWWIIPWFDISNIRNQIFWDSWEIHDVDDSDISEILKRLEWLNF